MSRPPPHGPFARVPPPAHHLFPASTFAPTAPSQAPRGFGNSSSSIYDNDDDVAQSLAEALGDEGVGGEWEGELQGEDEFGWRDDGGAGTCELPYSTEGVS